MEIAGRAPDPVRRGRTTQAGREGTPSKPPTTSAAAAAADAARELDAEVARLLRVRRGELAEPLGWHRPWLRLRSAAILAQLEPIRSRAALESSWSREAAHGPEVRLAYALAALAIDRRTAAARARRRPRVRFGPGSVRG